jgi:hypothetical protein
MKKVIFVVLNAIALLSCASMSRADEVLRMKPGIATMVRVPGAEKGDMKAIVGNPDIADVTFGPNNAFWFVGKKPGTTNIIVLNSVTGADAYKATIEVGPEPPAAPPDKTKIITMYILPKNIKDSLITREFYCDPGCIYLSPRLNAAGSGADSTTSEKIITGPDGQEVGRETETINSSSSRAVSVPAR